MKRLILFIGYWMLTLVLSAQTLSEQDILRRMTSAAEQTKTIRADFTQTKHSKMLREAQVSKGRMFCQQPDKLRWEYTSPRQSAIVLDGTKASISKNGTESGSRNRFASEMARMIMNSIAGKSLTDTNAFQISAKETSDGYEATLLPLRKEMKRMYAKLVLHFDTKQSTVTQVELFEKNGDRTIIDLHDIRINN